MVAKYKINAVLDFLRLVRGIFIPSKTDPFIEQSLRRIAHRRNLFQWSMIDHEVGEYENNYPEYVPYQSSQPLLIRHLPERYGRDAYQHLMQVKAFRLLQITTQLERAGIEVSATDECWFEIAEWLKDQRVISKEPLAIENECGVFFEYFIRPVYYSLVIDIGLLFGEHIIQVDPECQWICWADVPMDDPAARDRDFWILCDPLPKTGNYRRKPDRILPMEIIAMLSRSKRESSREILTQISKPIESDYSAKNF